MAIIDTLATTAKRRWSTEEMRARLVRYAELKPCLNAFIDTRSPGSEAKENFTIIGPGVSESPDQHVHIAEPHGFNIGGARQPPHCVNSQHSHETAEVFVVFSGDWTFNIGEHGQDVRIPAGPGTVASIPTGMFRGFTNVGQTPGFLWVALGGDDPGRVKWAPYVFDMASDYGLLLLEDGTLVDTAAGQAIPAGARVMPRTTPEEVARMRVPSAADVEALLVRPDAFGSLPQGPLTRSGVDERAVIGPANTREGLPAGSLGWPHGFNLRRVTLAPGAATGVHIRDEAEVVFVQSGAVTFAWTDGALELGPGDTLTTPVSLARDYRSAEGAVLFVVRGGDAPAPPRWL
jgi:mannose-6-phosphate isomerase-like protein (cupin superfamily)